MLEEQQAHYASFVKLAEAGLGWKGFVPRDWARCIPGCFVESLPDHHLSRSQLRDFCQDARTTNENAFIACMAWGGMNRRHGRVAWTDRDRWLPIVARLRAGGVSREDAYEAFLQANVAGLGPAYFTKIIYFVRPEKDGYILDQWTAKSISLMFTPVFISVTQIGWVSRMNGAEVYSRYCNAVERIAQKLDISAEITEEMMFSRGGRKKHVWRTYVAKNWLHRSIA